MPLPSLPPPPVSRDQGLCIAWLELALTCCLNVYGDIIRYDVSISPRAEELLSGLQEWLNTALKTERARQRNRRFANICWQRVRFLKQKYEAVRELLIYDATRQMVSLQTEFVPNPPPSTAL